MNKLLIFVVLLFVSFNVYAAQLTPEMKSFAHRVAKNGKISEKAVLKWLERLKRLRM